MLTEKLDLELADSVLEVSVEANRQMVEKLMGDESMYDVLMEIMEPRLQMRDVKVRIREVVDLLRDMNHSDEEIKATIMKRYPLSESEAEEYLGTCTKC